MASFTVISHESLRAVTLFVPAALRFAGIEVLVPKRICFCQETQYRLLKLEI